MRLLVQADTSAATRALNVIAGNARDLRPFFGRVVDEFHRIEGRRFQSSGDHGWRGLKPKTIRRKREKGLDRRILVARGALRTSLTSSVAAGSVVKISPTSVEVGTSIPYAKDVDKHRRLIEVKRGDRRVFSGLLVDRLLDGV